MNSASSTSLIDKVRTSCLQLSAGINWAKTHFDMTQFSFSADPATWGSALLIDQVEPDDYLHNPDPARDRKNDTAGPILTYRGLTNLGCLFILVAAMLTLLYDHISYRIAYFPNHFMQRRISDDNLLYETPFIR